MNFLYEFSFKFSFINFYMKCFPDINIGENKYELKEN